MTSRAPGLQYDITRPSAFKINNSWTMPRKDAHVSFNCDIIKAQYSGVFRWRSGLFLDERIFVSLNYDYKSISDLKIPTEIFVLDNHLISVCNNKAFCSLSVGYTRKFA